MDQQTLKRALSFLGLVFMICGSILLFFNSILYPFELYGFGGYIPQLIPPILILSIGVALYMVSKGL